MSKGYSNCNRACVVCLSTRNIDVSMHRFPTNPNIYSLWLKACGFNEKDNLKNSKICSRHFIEDNYKCLNPKRLLKKYAVPSIGLIDDFNRHMIHKVKEADVSNEVDNLTISNICLTHFTDESYKIPSIKTSLNKDVMTSIGLIDDNLQIFNILDQPIETTKDSELNESSNAYTDVLQSYNHDHSYYNCKSVEILPKKIGENKLVDLTMPDFVSPVKSTPDKILLKMKVAEQKKKIKILNQRLRRSKKKIKSLENLVLRLNNKSLLNNGAIESILVRYFLKITQKCLISKFG